LDPDNFKKTAAKVTISVKKGGFFLLSLNEPSLDHIDGDNITCIMGEELYSRPYTESEVREIFSKLGMNVLIVDREIIESKEYGKEYCLMVLMQKSA
jgi:hypothetical protein